MVLDPLDGDKFYVTSLDNHLYALTEDDGGLEGIWGSPTRPLGYMRAQPPGAQRFTRGEWKGLYAQHLAADGSSPEGRVDIKAYEKGEWKLWPKGKMYSMLWASGASSKLFDRVEERLK